jgi:hypothetical protein
VVESLLPWLARDGANIPDIRSPERLGQASPLLRLGPRAGHGAGQRQWVDHSGAWYTIRSRKSVFLITIYNKESPQRHGTQEKNIKLTTWFFYSVSPW